MIKKLIKILKKILPRSVLKVLIRFYAWYLGRKYSADYMEKSVKFGKKNPDISFYIIRRTPPAAGLFSNYMHVLGHLQIAEQRNLVPIIDMENNHTYYSEKNAINGTKNVWEYYFKQPCAYYLEEVYKSRNVILSSGEYPGIGGSVITICKDAGLIENLHKLSKKSICLNEITEKYVAEKAKNILLKDKKILGVASRGTDYVKKRPQFHPVQPSLEQLIELAKEKAAEWNIDFICLSTEETEVLERFRQVFPGKVVAVEKLRHDNYNSDLLIPDVRFERENDKYLTGLEYLAEIVILSRCNCFLGAVNSGVVAAIIMNGGKYEEKHIIDLGIYP